MPRDSNSWVNSRPRVAAAALLLSLATGASASYGEEVKPPPPPPRLQWVPTEHVDGKFTAAALAEALLVETNRVRALHRRRPLKPLEPLAAAADDQAAYLVLTGSANHISALPGQRTPLDRVERHGLEETPVAENVLAMTLVSGEKPLTPTAIAAQLVEQWMNSPGHRANLLSRDFTHVGSAIRFAEAIGNGERTYAVQTFANKPVSRAGWIPATVPGLGAN
jgi:uncharacterized protein YkwD